MAAVQRGRTPRRWFCFQKNETVLNAALAAVHISGGCVLSREAVNRTVYFFYWDVFVWLLFLLPSSFVLSAVAKREIFRGLIT